MRQETLQGTKHGTFPLMIRPFLFLITMSCNPPPCHFNFYKNKRRLIYLGSGGSLVNVNVNDMSVIDLFPPVNAVSADASTNACPVTAGQVIASASASRGSAADTYTYAALKASSVTAWCTIINPFTADVATSSACANVINLHLRSICFLGHHLQPLCWSTLEPMIQHQGHVAR